MESMCVQRRMGSSQQSAIQWVRAFKQATRDSMLQVQLCWPMHNRLTVFILHCRRWWIILDETHQPPYADPLWREWLCLSPQEFQHSGCKSFRLRHFLIDLQWRCLQCKKSVFFMSAQHTKFMHKNHCISVSCLDIYLASTRTMIVHLNKWLKYNPPISFCRCEWKVLVRL